MGTNYQGKVVWITGASSGIGRELALVYAEKGANVAVSCTTLHPGFVESNISRVDNEGNFHPDRDDQRPEKLMWPTRKAALVMFRAIDKRKRDYFFTGHGKFFAFIARHWPGLVHFGFRTIRS